MTETPEQGGTSRLEERVLREQVGTLYAPILAGSIVEFFITTVFWLVFYFQTRSVWIPVWAAAHLVISLHKVTFLARAYARQTASRGSPRSWEQRYCRAIFFTGCIWGVAAWVFIPPDDLVHAAVITLFILGKFTMGAISMVVSKQAVTNYVVPMAVGLSSALAWHGDAIHLFLGCASVAYAVVMLVFSRHLNKLLTDALMVRFEKEALAEKLSEQIAIATRASKEKTRFFAAASHDLRQPLHAIALFGAVLDKELQGQPEHVHTVRLMDAVEALSVSLDTMLDVSQLEAGVIKPDMRAVPLRPILETLNQMFSARATQKGLELRIRASVLWVHTDPLLLQRMLANLIENALKFTVGGGVIVIARERGPQVWLDVRDSGIGIAAENLDSIFEEFYQVGNAGRDRAQGLGIGLALVRRLSRLLGHPVHVHSRVGKGSRFRVVLPLAEEDFRSTEPPPAPDVHAADTSRLPRRVLVMDDEADICEALKALLGLHSVEAETVSNEADARRAFEQAAASSRPFEALLCDYRLQGGMDGLAAALRLRESYAPQLPVLMITGETSPARLQRIYDLGVPVLFKPVAATELLKALSQVAAR